jgi:endoglycosylceramidase
VGRLGQRARRDGRDYGTASNAAGARPTRLGLHVQLHIVDDQGRYLLLRGFNQDSLVVWPSWKPAPLEDTDAALIQQAGFNVVRLPISWSELEPRRGQINAEDLDRVQQTVAMLNAHNLYVVLDMHFS